MQYNCVPDGESSIAKSVTVAPGWMPSAPESSRTSPPVVVPLWMNSRAATELLERTALRACTWTKPPLPVAMDVVEATCSVSELVTN
jgi:hypothetical protein